MPQYFLSINNLFRTINGVKTKMCVFAIFSVVLVSSLVLAALSLIKEIMLGQEVTTLVKLY